MQYISTRGQVPAVSFSTAVAEGLAPDGGLYLPEELPDLKPHLAEWSKLSYAELCEAFFAVFATDIDSAELKEVVARSYTKFDHYWAIFTNHRSLALKAAFPFLAPRREILEPPLFMACSAKKASLLLSSILTVASRRSKSAR